MNLIDFILHIDQHLAEFVRDYDQWIYALLFAIVFVETGLVVMPFLPGDSMLFAAGALAATGAMDVWILFLLLVLAAVLGDTLNYHIGKYLGVRVFERPSKWIRQDYLHKTQAFFDRHGGKAIIFARFVPFARTFAPFVAGIGQMHYRYFLSYNAIGAVLWVGSLLALGYGFGNIPIVKNNFTIVIFAIIFISLLPALIEWIRHKAAHKSS